MACLQAQVTGCVFERNQAVGGAAVAVTLGSKVSLHTVGCAVCTLFASGPGVKRVPELQL
jgi:hypothetical protein